VIEFPPFYATLFHPGDKPLAFSTTTPFTILESGIGFPQPFLLSLSPHHKLTELFSPVSHTSFRRPLQLQAVDFGSNGPFLFFFLVPPFSLHLFQAVYLPVCQGSRSVFSTFQTSLSSRSFFSLSPPFSQSFLYRRNSRLVRLFASPLCFLFDRRFIKSLVSSRNPPPPHPKFPSS